LAKLEHPAVIPAPLRLRRNCSPGGQTGNEWCNRDKFVVKAGKYAFVQREYAADPATTAAAAAARGPEPPSRLDPRVQDLIKLICDLRMMKESMVEYGYDPEKMPLRKLSREHLLQALKVLKEVSDELDGAKSQARFLELSNTFYSMIPFKTTGMRPPEIINPSQLLKARMTMIESLGEVAMATRLLQDSVTVDADGKALKTIDVNFQQLNCKMTPLERGGVEMEMIKRYCANTHGPTHTQFTIEVLDAFSLEREGEAESHAAVSWKQSGRHHQECASDSAQGGAIHGLHVR
jgi:poly [ADP-ribose] polymerase